MKVIRECFSITDGMEGRSVSHNGPLEECQEFITNYIEASALLGQPCRYDKKLNVVWRTARNGDCIVRYSIEE